MEKRLIIAIALSISILVIFQFLSPSGKKQNFAQVQRMAQNETAASPQRQTPPIPAIEKQKFEEEEKEVTAETEKYILTFTNKGGSLKDVRIKEYLDPKTHLPLYLVANAEGDRAVLSMESDELVKGLGCADFTLVKQDKDRVVYEYTIPGTASVEKEFSFHKSFDYIELRIKIKNISPHIIYKDYDILGGSGLQQIGLVMGRTFLEIDSMVDGKLVRSSKVKTGENFIQGIISWTGIKERYFCIILKPQQDSEGVILRQFGKTDLASGIKSKKMPIYPGNEIEDLYILYAGPNDITRLKSLGLGLEHIVNYGIFDGITKILLFTLRKFHSVVKNWGVAIILLTFLINLVLFPLTRKSFTSMRKIQEVQPHIEKLRKVHKDNPQKLNKEMAGLYKQYNINPFGGCLPLLLQMPIFISLYQGLIRSIELKGANFLWIKDLSSPDSVALPFKLPFLGNEIHVLPLLMVGAMFLQQKISSASTPTTSQEQMQQQRIMLMVFPLFFGFLFYNFPSGLVLYWLTNTVLMVAEQSLIRRSFSHS